MPGRIAAWLPMMTVLLAAPADAHHSFAAEFDYDLTGTIEGEVVEALYVNPHVRYFVSVVGEDGKEEIWDAQTRSVSALTRVGWTKDLIKVGDRVVLEGNLGRDGARKIWIRELKTASGRVIRPTEAVTDDEEAEE